MSDTYQFPGQYASVQSAPQMSDTYQSPGRYSSTQALCNLPLRSPAHVQQKPTFTCTPLTSPQDSQQSNESFMSHQSSHSSLYDM